MKTKLSILIIAAIFFFVFFAHTTWSASYDLYVDESYKKDDADGSSDKPYETLVKALEKAASGDKIYIKNGKYTGNVILGKEVELYGQDKNKTIIEGSGIHSVITAEGNNLIKNLTVQGGSTGIASAGKIKITDCKIQSASKKGVDLLEGGATLTLENSKITKNGKGVYAQKGSDIAIFGNEVTNNNEEGIDIREKVSGTISGNYIAGNGEGGIELVVGSSNILIKNNQIKKNKASGIAVQFYSQASKTGEITLKNNIISANGAYGLKCTAPSGDDYSKGYWNKSLEVLENTIENNKGKAIAGSCKLIEAVTEEEEEKNAKIESATSNQEPLEADLDAEKKLQEERAREIMEKENKLNGSFKEASSAFKDLGSQAIPLLQEIKNRNRLTYFFLGADSKKMQTTKEFLEKAKENKKLLEQSLSDSEGIENSLVRENALNLIKEMDAFIISNENLVSERENRFSLFSWFRKIFTR